MIIQCTKALLDEIGIKPGELVSAEGHEQYPESLYAWHAHLIRINRRKVLVLMNNETRFPIVVNRFTKKERANLNETIRLAIANAFHMEGIRGDIVDAYMAKAGSLAFSKTAGRSILSKLNNTIRDVEFSQEFLDPENSLQRYISMVAGRMVQSSEGRHGYYPVTKLIEAIEKQHLTDDEKVSKSVFEVELYQLKIKLDLEGHDIWRRVCVPSTFSFRFLHVIIQTVFDWQNYHLHEFEISDEGKKSIRIVMDDDPDTFEYLDREKEKILQERFVALKDIFTKYDQVLYRYDFGDDWEHRITLEKVIYSSTEPRATFIEGNGERPPEDVGGLGGFEEYLRIIADKNDPEYAHTVTWAAEQRERVLTKEQMNWRLRNINSGYSYSTFVINK